MTGPECSRVDAGTPGMEHDQTVDLTRPERPSDYGSPSVNWPAFAAASVAMAVTILAVLAWVGVL